MDRSNVDQRRHREQTHPLPGAIRRAQLRELASRWIRFIRFIELQRRIDAGEPLLRLIRPDAKAQ